MADLLIQKNYKVIVIDNFLGGHKKNLAHIPKKKLKIINEDIRYLDFKKKIFKNTKFLFHFAGIGDIVPSIEKPKIYADININGTINILELKDFIR